MLLGHHCNHLGVAIAFSQVDVADFAVEVGRFPFTESDLFAILEVDAYAARKYHGKFLSRVANIVVELAEVAGDDPRVQRCHAAAWELAAQQVILVAACALTRGLDDTGADYRRLCRGVGGRVRRE